MARYLLAVALCALLAADAAAQVTVSVEPDDPVLRRIDRLVAEGAIRSAVAGQRPWSRNEVARLLAEARAHADSVAALDPAAAARIRDLLAIDSARFAVPASTRLLARAAAEGGGGEANWRAIPYGGRGPLGQIDAITSPLFERRHGRFVPDGPYAAFETSHRLQLGRAAAVAVSPRLWGGADSNAVLDLRIANVTLGARNVRLTVGRDYLMLGQGMHGGGLMLSDNAPALDMIRVSSDAPFRLPWIFRRMGDVHANAFLADLGADRDIPHAKLAGWKLSFMPSPRVEWGVSVLSQQGGRGAPEASALERIVDLVPLVDVLLLQDSDLLFSNKLAGLDLRLRFPRAHGLELYIDGVADDFDIRRVASSLTEDAAWVVGAAIIRPGGSARHRFDIEARALGLRFYQHEQFTSGLTLDGFVLGDPIAARSQGLAARWTLDPGGRFPVSLTAYLEQRSNDQYEVTVEDETAAGFTFHKVEDRPEETRQRLTLLATPQLPGGRDVRLLVDGGVERVSTFGFTAGEARTNYLLRVGLDARF